MVKYLRFGAINCVVLLCVSLILFGTHTLNVLSLFILLAGVAAWIVVRRYDSITASLKITSVLMVSLVFIMSAGLLFLIITNFPKHPEFTSTIMFTPHSAESERIYDEFVAFTEEKDGLSALDKEVTAAFRNNRFNDEIVKKAYADTVNERNKLENILRKGHYSMSLNYVKWDGKMPQYSKVRSWLQLELSELYRMSEKGRSWEAKKRYNELWNIVLSMYEGNQPLIGVVVTRSLTLMLTEFPFSWKNGMQAVDKEQLINNLKKTEVLLDHMFIRGIEVEYLMFQRSLEGMTSDAMVADIIAHSGMNRFIFGYLSKWPFFDKNALLSQTHSQFIGFRDDHSLPYYKIAERNITDPPQEWKRPPLYKNMLGNLFFAIAMPSYDTINLAKEKAKSQIISARVYLEGGVPLVEKTIDPLTGKSFIVQEETGVTTITTGFEEDEKPVWRYTVR